MLADTQLIAHTNTSYLLKKYPNGGVVSPHTSKRIAPQADDVAEGFDQLHFLASEMAKPDIFHANVSGTFDNASTLSEAV